MSKAFLETIKGNPADHMPIWLMRQAGRYLPEYRALRAEAGSFLGLCLNPKWAAEITMQPVRRFQMDAAILFADILLIPMALGQRLEFKEGEGPVLEPLDEKKLSAFVYDEKKLAPVFETVSSVKNHLPESTALIGFCGGMWTVAAYMIDGNSKSGFVKAKAAVVNNPAFLEKLFSHLLDASEKYLGQQIEAGAECLQIFESWAGLLAGPEFERWVIEPTAELVKRIKKKYPSVPILGFPREAGAQYETYAAKTGINGLSIDQNADLDQVKSLQKYCVLQGNLDPADLVQGGEAMKKAAARIIEKLGPRHIFNLGHGVVPQTPPEHVAELVRFVHEMTK